MYDHTEYIIHSDEILFEGSIGADVLDCDFHDHHEPNVIIKFGVDDNGDVKDITDENVDVDDRDDFDGYEGVIHEYYEILIIPIRTVEAVFD